MRGAAAQRVARSAAQPQAPVESRPSNVINFPDPPRGNLLTRDDPSAFAAPAQFGPFRVLHQIGVGALGPVFRTYEPDARSAGRREGLPSRHHARAGAGAGRRADTIRRGRPVPSVDRRADRRRRRGDGRLSRRGIRRRRVARRRDAALRAGADRHGAAVHHAARRRDRFCARRRRRPRRAAPARHLRHARRGPATGFGVVEALERVGLRAPVRRPYSRARAHCRQRRGARRPTSSRWRRLRSSC